MATTAEKKKGDFAGWIVIGIILAIIISAIIAAKFFRTEEKLKVSFRNGKIISFVIAGYNDDSKLIKGTLVALFNPTTNRVAIVSIPVKTYTDFGKKNFYTVEEALIKKINYEDFKIAIEKLINHKIDYYIFIEKNNFIKFVDMISGVEVFSPKIKNIEKKIDIPEGITLLDGDKSIEYLSYEVDNKQESTYDHLKRVQNVFRGMLTLKSDFLEDFNEPFILNYLSKTLNTNMTKNDVLIFYNEIKKRYSKNITDFSKGSENIILYCDKKTIPNYDYILMPKKSGEWVKGEVKESLANLRTKIKIDESGQIFIEIQNGTDIVGLGIRTKKYLETFGFDISDVGNAENNSYPNTIVIIRNSEQKSLKLADLVKCKKVIKGEPYQDKKIDATLILGKDFDGRVVK
jgi:polyisoprenyl-teichoic acid--peptidoglycan teichoic acid transferase